MLCYKDKTFCSYWTSCKNGYYCDRALTEQVKQDAITWWGNENAPLSTFSKCPECFVQWSENDEQY